MILMRLKKKYGRQKSLPIKTLRVSTKMLAFPVGVLYPHTPALLRDMNK